MPIGARQNGASLTRRLDRARLIRAELDKRIELAGLPPDLRAAVRSSCGVLPCIDKTPSFGLVCLYCYESAGGEDIRQATPAAAAIEFLAAAASVLDDLQDGDPLPIDDDETPGAGAELVSLLLVLSRLALDSIDTGRIPARRVLAAHSTLSRYELRGLVGQHVANGLSSKQEVTLEEALHSTEAKSGAFGGLAAEMGALLATEDRKAISDHSRFGRLLGTVTQIQNDIADLWPRGRNSTDLALARKSAPLAFALSLRRGASESADQLMTTLGAGTVASAEENALRDHLFRSGAIHWSLVMGLRYRVQARSIATEQARRNPGSRLADLIEV